MMKSLHEQSIIHWEGRADAGHRNTDESSFERYASELIALLPCGGSLLDVGCGACDCTAYLATKFERVIGLDFSAAMLRSAQARLAQLQLTNVTLLQGDATSLPVAGKRVNALLANQVLQYLDNSSLEKHLAECARVLAADGIVCWANIPNVHRRQLWYAGAFDTPPPSFMEMSRRWWNRRRDERRAQRRGDKLWDGIGRWFEPLELKRQAEAAGFFCEFRYSWFYEYRFHALLHRTPAARTI